MTDGKPDFAAICAYVDGELDPADAARVAYAAARDPAVAAQVAQLTKLKSVMPDAVVDLGGEPFAELPSRSKARARHVRTRLRAACIAGLVAVATAFFALTPFDSRTQSSTIEAALDRHKTWSAELGATSAGAQKTAVAAGAERAFAAPDLSAARLALRTAETFALESGNVLHFGYVGTRGCKISVFVFLDGAPSAPEGAGIRHPYAAAWSNDGFGYLVVAEGMDAAHFATIVQVLQRYSIERTPIDGALGDRLAESRSRSKPCLA
jgi:anti-sigma factor RsiW